MALPARAEAPAPSVPAPAATCPNCGATPVRQYCPDCGQRQDSERPTLRHLLREIVDDLFSLDAKLVGTLRPLLFRPGFLTTEHFAGRRDRYVRPFKLYLTANVVLFLLLALLPTQRGMWADARKNFDRGVQGSTEDVTPAKTRDLLLVPMREHHPAFAAHLERFLASGGNDLVAPFRDAYVAAGPKIDMLVVPWFALLLLMLFRGSDRLYAEHFVFALHLQTFQSIFTCLDALASLVPYRQLTAALEVAIAIVPLVYGFLALRRVYATSRGGTLLRMAVLLTISGLTKVALIAAAIGWFIWRA